MSIVKNVEIVITREDNVCDGQDFLTIEEAIEIIDATRKKILFNVEEEEEVGLPPMSKSCFIKSLAALEIAKQEMMLANYYRMRND